MYDVSKHKYDDDEIAPKLVHEHLNAHDHRMRVEQPKLSEAKAHYTSRYWRHINGEIAPIEQKKVGVEIEVNRLWPIVTSYLAALYPRENKAVVSAAPSGGGDPAKAALTINQFLLSHRIHQRVMTGLRQAILYPGCGAKIGYKPGWGNALERAWMRIIPWWEMLLDFDVNDPEDERFRGHVYYRPKHEIEQEYDLHDITGTRRIDYLASRFGLSKQPDALGDTGNQLQAPSDQQNFVRVLEFVNLVDTIADHRNPSIRYKGRLEIYVLGQGDLSRHPVWMGPLPFAKVDGSPLSHIVPLIFNHEPEFPLRGIPHTRRMLPQLREINAYRSWMATTTRKDTRQYLARKGYLDADKMAMLTEGYDGLIIEVDKDDPRPLEQIIAAVPTSPISVNIRDYMNLVEVDLERETGSSPNARGTITKATAFETQVVQQYTESEFGMHAEIKDQWLMDCARVLLRAVIAAMGDRGDSAGAFEEAPAEMAPVGAEPDETPEEGENAEREEIAAQEREAVVSGIEGSEPPLIDEGGVPPLGRVAEGPDAVAIEQETLRLQERGEFVDIAVQDLDADFEISFDEGSRTPLKDEQMQRNLVGLMENYMGLWKTAQESGPVGIAAMEYLRAMADRFELPKNLHPDSLARMVKEKEDEEAAKPKPKTEPPPNGAGPPGAMPPEAAEILQRAASLPPDQAIEVLGTLFTDNPQLSAALEQAKTLPPDQQARIVQDLIGRLSAQPEAT
jgi:hypothetical protein